MYRCWKYGIGQFIISWSVGFFLLGDAYIEALTGIDASNSGEIVISKGAYAYLHGVDDLETNLTEDPLEGIKTEIGKTNDESKPSNLIKLYGVQARKLKGMMNVSF